MKPSIDFIRRLAGACRVCGERGFGVLILTGNTSRRASSNRSCRSLVTTASPLPVPPTTTTTTTTTRTDEDPSEAFTEMDEYDDLGEDDANMHPWKTLLQIPARAAWRISPVRAPAALQEVREHILKTGERSNRELHQIQQQIIELHQKLVGRRDRERIRTVTNRVYAIQEQKRDARDPPVTYGPNEVFATVKFRLVPNFFIVRRVLEEARSLVGCHSPWQPQRILDFGIGCGSAAVAGLDVWNKIEWIHGIDPSQSMREGAKLVLEEFIQRDERFSNTRVTLSAHLSAEQSPPAFDLALFTYTATELPHNGSILAAAALLWDKLRPNGLFVMVEPGTPDGFSSVRTVRNMLRACCNPDSPDHDNVACHVLAPCTHNGPCPLTSLPKEYVRRFQQEKTGETDDEESDSAAPPEIVASRHGFCSFIHSMPPQDGETKVEKFSYLVAQKRIVGVDDTVEGRFGQMNLSDLLTRTHLERSEHNSASFMADEQLQREASQLASLYIESNDDPLGLELLSGDRNRRSYGRIINPPMKRKGHVLIECCSSPGDIIRYKISKSMSKTAPGIYAAARKSRWGGYWPDSQFGRDEDPSRYTSSLSEKDTTNRNTKSM